MQDRWTFCVFPILSRCASQRECLKKRVRKHTFSFHYCGPIVLYLECTRFVGLSLEFPAFFRIAGTPIGGKWEDSFEIFRMKHMLENSMLVLLRNGYSPKSRVIVFPCLLSIISFVLPPKVFCPQNKKEQQHDSHPAFFRLQHDRSNHER